MSEEPEVVRPQPYVWAAKPSKSAQLVQRVIDAGGSLRVNPVLDGVSYGSLISNANMYRMVPPGKRLAWAAPDRHGYGYRDTICLEDLPAWLTAVLDAVPMPGSIPTDDPVLLHVCTLSHDPELVRAAKKQANLAIHALAEEARRRGYEVMPGAHPGQPTEHGFRRRQPVHFTITTRGQHIALAVRPDDSWTPGGDYPRNTYVPGTRFTICVLNGKVHRQSGWPFGEFDLTSMYLAQILHEVEPRAALAEAEEVVREEQRRQRRIEWSKAMDDARQQWREHHLEKWLRRIARDWQLSRTIDGYLVELARAIQDLEESDQEEVMRWHDWATKYRDGLDPLHGGVTIPPDREPSKDDLAPFLDRRWSPHGPDHRAGWRT